jgi:hypothetical protein
VCVWTFCLSVFPFFNSHSLTYTHTHTHTQQAFLTHAPITSLGSYSILLTDPDEPSHILDHITYTHTYDLHIDGFLPERKVEVYIVPEDEVGKGSAAAGGAAADTGTERKTTSDATGVNTHTHTKRHRHTQTTLNKKWLQATLTTDTDRHALLKRRFAPLLFPPGVYVCVCVDVSSGAYGMSLPYTFSKETRRRKLYGPWMWV